MDLACWLSVTRILLGSRLDFGLISFGFGLISVGLRFDFGFIIVLIVLAAL